MSIYEWIRVERGKPESGEEVIVLTDGGHVQETTYEHGCFMCEVMYDEDKVIGWIPMPRLFE